MGASQAKGKTILFVDSDVVLRADTILKMEEAVESLHIDALVAIYEKEPLNKGFFPRFKSLHNWSYSKFRNGEIRPHTVFATFCAMIRKDVFDEIGGFDTKYKSNDVEDYELGYRLVDGGLTLYRHSGIEVGHHFPDLRKGIRIYRSRCFQWTDLFLGRLKFDTGGTSGRDALGMLAGSMIPFFLIFRLTLPLLVSIMVYFLCFRALFTLFYKTAGFSFLVRGILVQLLLSCVVVFSSSFAIITHPIRKR